MELTILIPLLLFVLDLALYTLYNFLTIFSLVFTGVFFIGCAGTAGVAGPSLLPGTAGIAGIGLGACTGCG
jgi:hypothetical protein